MAEDEIHEDVDLEEQEVPEEPAEDELLTIGDELPGEELPADELPPEEPAAEELPPEEPVGEEDLEVDVTSLVDTAEEAKDEVMGKMEDLLGKLSDLENKVGGMDKVISKISSLEAEMKERIPTPVEQLELRSLDSYPYNVKLTDFWADKGYLNTEKEEEKEYKLTMDDVKSDYDEVSIKDSFDDDDSHTSVYPTA